MSEILGRAPGYEPQHMPLHRVRCANCKRVYQTRCYPAQIRKYRYCIACSPGSFRGERAPHAKLTNAAVATIRKEYTHTLKSARALAERFGVASSTIRHIASGRNRPHG